MLTSFVVGTEFLTVVHENDIAMIDIHRKLSPLLIFCIKRKLA